MGAALSRIPVPTLGLMGLALVAVAWCIRRAGLATFILSTIVTNGAIFYIAYNIVFYSFTSPVGDDDPHKKLKNSLEDQHLREANEQLRAGASGSDDISGWFTMRTTFKERKEGDTLFEQKREDVAAATASEEDKRKKAANGGKPTLASRALNTYRHLSKSAAVSASTGPRNYYLVRLKGTVLFVYRAPEGYNSASPVVPDKDDPNFECLGAVSVDQHVVTVEDSHGEYHGIEGRYYNKRNAIVLRPVQSQDGKKTGLKLMSRHMSDMTPEETLEHEDKSIFMFSKNNSLTEDMYFALLRVSARPVPYKDVFSLPHLKWLIDEVSGMTDPSGLGWFNALAGRIFLGINQTALVEQFIIDKINKKLALAKHPIIRHIAATEANVGHIPPLFSNAMLKRTELHGDIAFQAQVSYRQAPELPGSGICITIEADVGVSITLTVRITSLSGDVEVKIKQAPTNRFWWGFVEPPKMDMKIEPVVGSRTINLALVTNFIERKLREGLAESIVLPNMDDIPFFHTEGMSTRGGIFDQAMWFTGEDKVQKMFIDKDDEECDAVEQDIKAIARAETTKTIGRPSSAPSDVLETNKVLRTETTPALTDRLRKLQAAGSRTTKISHNMRSSVTSVKSTVSTESSSPQDDKRLRGDSQDFGPTSITSASSNGTGSTSPSERSITHSSSTLTEDLAETSRSASGSTSAPPGAMRVPTKDATLKSQTDTLKTQAGVAKDSIKKWGVNFVNKHRQTKKDGDSGSDQSPTVMATAQRSAYYVPSPEPPAVPVGGGAASVSSRTHTGMSLQERLAAAAAAKTAPTAAQRLPSGSAADLGPAPMIQPRRVPSRTSTDLDPGTALTAVQPAARQMIVPHVPKRPGVVTSLSSEPPATGTLAAQGPAPVPASVPASAANPTAVAGGSTTSSSSLPLVSSLTSATPPRASPAPPKISRGDSDPLPEVAVADLVDLRTTSASPAPAAAPGGSSFGGPRASTSSASSVRTAPASSPPVDM